MRVVDTSAWIEHFIASPTGKRLAPEFPTANECLVPTIVQHELAKWLTRELDEQTSSEVIAFTNTCLVVQLDTRTALIAADLSRQHKLATADAIIYATALRQNVALLTCDAHFKDLPHVIFIAKTATPQPTKKPMK
jgi:predicted nucleic acid-binding protein